MLLAFSLVVADADTLVYAIEHNINPIHIASDIRLSEVPNADYMQAQILGNSFTLRVFNQTQPIFKQIQSMVKNLFVDFQSSAAYGFVYFASTVYSGAFYDCVFNVSFETDQFNAVLFQDFRNSNIGGMHVFVDVPKFELFFSASQVFAEALSLNTQNRQIRAQIAYTGIYNCEFNELMLSFQIDTDDHHLIAPILTNFTVHNAIFYVQSPRRVLPVGETVTNASFTNVFINGTLSDFVADSELALTNVWNTSGVMQFMSAMDAVDRAKFIFRDSSLKMHLDFTQNASVSIDRNAPFLVFSLPLCGDDQFQFGTMCTEDSCDLLGDTCSGQGDCLFFGRYACQCARGYDGFKACRECQGSFLEVDGGCYERVGASDHGTCWKQDDIILCQCDPGYVDRYCDKKIAWQQTISATLSIACFGCICATMWLVYWSATWWKREERAGDDRIPLQI